MTLWIILTSNQGIRYININVIMIFILLTMIRLFLPFEYGFTNNIPCKMVLPTISKFMYKHFFIGYRKFYVYQVFLLIWITGFLIKLSQVVIQYYKICQNIKNLPTCYHIKSILDELLTDQNRYVNFKVVSITGLTTPVIFGLRHPTIMIPNNEYSDEELTYILHHELEHFYQHDLWIKAILEFLCAIYWWNPFCKFFKKQVSKALELRTDNKVIKSMNEQQRLMYLNCILKVAKNHAKPMNNLGLGFDGKRTSLKQRFYYILDYQVTKRKTLIIVNSILAGLIIFLSTTIILEPYSIKSENATNTFIISADNSYFVKSQDGYDLYVNSTYYATINEPKDSLLALPVYESLEKETK